MSGTNRLILSESTLEGESESALTSGLMNANSKAAKKKKKK